MSQETAQVVWYSYLLKNFPKIAVNNTVKGFGIVNKAEIDVLNEETEPKQKQYSVVAVTGDERKV